MTAVLADDVMLVVAMVAANDELDEAVPMFTALGKAIVTPAGRLLNVKRICVELATRVPSLLPFCVLVLQQFAQPSVRMNAPCDLATFLLVKIVAAPAPGAPEAPPIVELPGARPMEKLPMPGFKLLMTVPVDGEPIR